MDKLREEFEEWREDFHNGRQINYDYVEEDNSYAVGYANAQWVAWQAAKASSIPEGYVIVPKKATKEIAGAFWNAFTENPRAMTMAIAWDAMIEAVEKNDE